jgi:hypothetical protein
MGCGSSSPAGGKNATPESAMGRVARGWDVMVLAQGDTVGVRILLKPWHSLMAHTLGGCFKYDDGALGDRASQARHKPSHQPWRRAVWDLLRNSC